MSISSVIRSLLSFLTTIPIGMPDDAIDLAAEHMYMFPVIGAFIGLLAGIPAYLFFLFLPRDLAGFFTYGALQAITGLQHLDGLLDFGDGVVTHGTPQRKIGAMKDTSLGVGGVFTGVLSITLTVLLMGRLGDRILIPSLVVCETTSKLSMVLLAWLGRPAGTGMGSRFVDCMQRKTKQFLLSLAFTILVAWTALGWTGIGSAIAGLLGSLALLELAKANFNGVTGDVLGASNELTRITILMLIAGVGC